MDKQSPRNPKNAAAGETRDCGGQPQTALGGGNTEAVMAVEVREGSGAPPSNTAPANCIAGENFPIQVLRQGIDSLYLSYPGDLSFSRSLELDILKKQARAETELEQAEAVYSLPGHQFQVHGKGYRLYTYLLTDNAYRICLSSLDSKLLPLAYVQIKSDWLILRSVRGAVAELDVIIEHFGVFDEVQIQANVSRADLFVDFVCDFPFEGLPVESWVSRAKRISTHTVGRAFTGLSFGLGGDLSARLYDKTKELEESKKDHLKALWKNKGWDGQSTVWRLEFQYKRPILKEHDAGSVEGLLAKLASLWRYSCQAWLKLTLPSATDSTQSRWPVHPVWLALAQIDWGMDDQPASIPVRADSPPTDYFLFVNGLSSLSSFMARENILDPDDAFQRFLAAARHFHNSPSMDWNGKSFTDYLIEKAAAKARKWNLPYQGIGDNTQATITEAKAKAYRKQRDGE